MRGGENNFYHISQKLTLQHYMMKNNYSDKSEKRKIEHCIVYKTFIYLTIYIYGIYIYGIILSIRYMLFEKLFLIFLSFTHLKTYTEDLQCTHPMILTKTIV